MPIRVLLVCTGNTCRSSMGEALLRRLASRSGEPPGRAADGAGAGDVSAGVRDADCPAARGPAVEIEVRSAGTGAREGDPASEHAIEVMRERGIDLRPHRARRLTQDLVDWADVILTMTTGQKSFVIRTFSGAAGKTFTLGEYAAGARGTAAGRSLAGAGAAGGGAAAGGAGAGGAGAGGAVDIEDPFGGPVEAYRRAADQIEAALAAAWRRMVGGFGRGEDETGGRPE